jgi:hypothetical protein
MLIDLFCRDGKDTKSFNHDFHDCVRHSRVLRERKFGIESIDVLNAPEEAKEVFSI